MSNPQKNGIQNEIERIRTETNLLRDRLKKPKKSQNLISKWVNAPQNNTSKRKIK